MLAVLFGLLVGYPTVMVVETGIAGAGMVGLVAQDGCSIPLQVGLRLRLGGWTSARDPGRHRDRGRAARAGRRRLTAVLRPAAAGRASRADRDDDGWRPRLSPCSQHKTCASGARWLADLPHWPRWLSVVYFQIAQIMVSVSKCRARPATWRVIPCAGGVYRAPAVARLHVACRCLPAPPATTTSALTMRVAGLSRRCSSPVVASPSACSSGPRSRCP